MLNPTANLSTMPYLQKPHMLIFLLRVPPCLMAISNLNDEGHLTPYEMKF